MVLLALVLVGSDVWIIFTNQAIYLENSLMILIILAIWVYWRATHTFPVSRSRYLTWYGLAGLLAGCVIIYKQIGGFIVLVVLLNLLLQRKHWLGHAVLCGLMLLVVAGYGVAMHLAFGTLYDTAMLDQLHRTLGEKAAPGLNDSVLAALQAIWSRYHPDPLSPGNVSPPQPISTGDRQLGAWGGTVCAWYLVKKPSLYDPVDSATLPGARTGNL